MGRFVQRLSTGVRSAWVTPLQVAVNITALAWSCESSATVMDTR